MVFAGAAVLAGVHVLEVLTATHLWRFAEVVAFLLLAGYAALRGEPRWLGPVAVSPLVLDALLTVPPAGPRTYGWQVLTTEQAHPHLVLDALDQGFRQGGAALLFVLTLLAARPAGRRRVGGMVTVAVGLGLAIAGYAGGRVALGVHGVRASSVVALGGAVLVPLLLALAALALAAAVGRGAAVVGGVLIAAATLPMIDAMIGSVPLPSVDAGLFGWDAITPTGAFPAPVAAVTEGLLLAGVLFAMAGFGRASRRGS
jgi:hypothetical protein